MSTSVPLKDTKLFKPVQLTDAIKLQHRLVVPPLGRIRATGDHTPSDLQLEHYDKASREPGSLVITEATAISKQAGGYPYIPGIWDDKHFAAWKQIVDKVHENKSYLSVQLWSIGAPADVGVLTAEGSPYKSASDGIYLSEEIKEKALKLNNPLTALTVEEIKDYVKQYGYVAERAVKESGFDVLEIHSAHGYLFDQFFQTVTNKRTDQYGGSIENRARFFLEVIDEVISKVGIEKVAFRLSPWAQTSGMEGAKADPHPVVTYGYILHEMQKRANKARAEGKGKGFAYLSIVEPRVNGTVDFDSDKVVGSNDFVSLIWDGNVIRAGNFEKHRDALVKAVEDENDKTLIAIGRVSISNPDLVHRLKNDLELTPYDRSLFYSHTNWGYNSYGNYGEGPVIAKEIAEKQLPKPLA